MRPAVLALLVVACAGDADTTDATDTTDVGTVDSGTIVSTCSGWDMLTTMHPDVSLDDLSACTTEAGQRIEASLMSMDGITITGDSVVGDDGTNVAVPCVEVRCDADYAYIASNALPHYDPQAAPIFDTVETPIVHRVPLSPIDADSTAVADDWNDVQGCDTALSNAVVNATPESPPMNHCYFESEDDTIVNGEVYIADGDDVVHKVLCYGQTGSVITGVPTFAPCEEARPDPYGSPLFATWADQATLFVDLCGTHPAAITHNHWLNEECLLTDEDNAPVNSYATGAAAFDIESLDAADCTDASAILGWSYDGYPIMGSCLCMERDADGACTDARRARSGYVYEGLARWADGDSEDPNLDPTTVAESYFGQEGAACDTDQDCCEPGDNTCRLYCHPLLVEDDGGDVVMDSVCATPDYSWCGHEWVDHDEPTEDPGYVYLDRCNGVMTADGYAYAGTVTFPYVNGCYRGEPTASALDETYIYLDAGDGPGGPGGGGGPP